VAFSASAKLQRRVNNPRYFGEWTTSRCEQLRTLWDDKGLSAGLIAREMHTTRNAIIGKAYRMRLSPRGSTANVADKSIKPTRVPTKPRARPRPAAVTPIRVQSRQYPPGAPIPLIDLQSHHCRWVLGDPRDMLFCGQRKLEPHSYCELHVKQAYSRKVP
jgi:GcrA cell cycle regulator